MEKSILIAITVFVVVSLAVFVIGSLLDRRSARPLVNNATITTGTPIASPCGQPTGWVYC